MYDVLCSIAKLSCLCMTHSLLDSVYKLGEIKYQVKMGKYIYYNRWNSLLNPTTNSNLNTV